jgi:PAS domain-containing protein
MKEWRLRGVVADEVVEIPPAAATRPGPSPDSARALLDQFPGLLWTTDSELRVTSCLGREWRSMGVGPNQLSGTEIYRLFEPDGVAAFTAHTRALGGDTVPFSIRVAGRVLHAKVAPLTDAAGRTFGVIGQAVESPLRHPVSAVRD